MTTDTPPAIVAPAPPKPTTLQLENALLMEQVVDDFWTNQWLHEPTCKGCSPHVELDPIARPLARSLAGSLAESLVINGGLRLLPESTFKRTGLMVIVTGEGVNVIRNFTL